ncbi:MAG: response regulator [Kiritimatiellaeota bacterium]|nr:response regulator [Kiritimatiellota bacterium]
MKEDSLFALIKQALAQAPEAVLVSDVEGRTVMLSRGFTELTGFTVHELRERSEYFFCWKAERDPSTAMGEQGLCECVTHLPAEKAGSAAVRIRCRQVRASEASDAPVLGYVATCVPVGGEGEPSASATQLRTYEALRAESLVRLAGGIAHNFNNALAGLIGVASLAREMHLNDTMLVRDLDDILTQARRMGAWTKHMLSYAQQNVRNPIRTSINRIVESAVDLLRPAVGPHYKLTVELGEGLPEVLVDLSEMQEVIEQITVNAAEASGNRGALRIITECARPPFAARESGKSEASWVRISFRDDGPGMTSETLSRVFDPFFSTRFTGRGLGLAVVKGIVEAHGGRVMVQSGPERGTRFDVLLPPAPAALEQKPRGRTKHRPRERNELGGRRLLVVEDEVLLAGVLKDYFERLGMKVLVAYTGARAIELLKATSPSPDLCLMDIVMPDCLGTELFYRMRELCPGMAVLLCTAYQEADPVQDLLDAGAAGLVRKPFDVSELAAKVAEVLTAPPAASE